jgi:[ribosomal protein S18]-alanine N-acetyltransferase
LTGDKILLRPFRKDDCDAALAIATDLGLSPWTLADYRDELARRDSEMIAAVNGSKLAGFIVGRRVPASGQENGIDAEIYNIGVARGFQDSGVGSRLLENFIERCRQAGVRDIWLEARSANTKAVRFYKRFGFNEFAVRRAFYRDPTDDGIVMRLELASCQNRER